MLRTSRSRWFIAFVSAVGAGALPAAGVADTARRSADLHLDTAHADDHLSPAGVAATADSQGGVGAEC